MKVLALLLLLAGQVFAAEPVIDCVTVRTRSPENPTVKVWYRVPKNYDANGKGLSRVLILFGGRNCDGRPEVSGKLGWTEWADLNGIFLVAPTLKDDNYWEPEKWSGRAVHGALDQIAAKYRIATTGLLYYGYSAGSQASNLFPAWRPDLCRAYVSHACGVFHTPTSRMNNVAGLVTCGDADTARYVISRRFVDSCRRFRIPVVWKSFSNHRHDVPPDSVRLAKEFLAHWHWSRPDDLNGRANDESPDAAYVGDDADGTFYPADSCRVADIQDEDRVALPSESVARAWGRPGREGGPRPVGRPVVTTSRFDGVEVVSVIPGCMRSDARVVVLVGGRGWSGERSVRELGFADWAVGRGWCLVAPSFSEGEYWNPASGSGAVIRKSVAALRDRHGLRDMPVFLFGYSAGGQLVTLLQEADPKLVAAWAVYGCGVFPERPVAGAPALVACGRRDDDRHRISRDFIYRYREAGGWLVWNPTRCGHELDAATLELTRLFFAAVAAGGNCLFWGEDDTRKVCRAADIDIEFRNPLYDAAVLKSWRWQQ